MRDRSGQPPVAEKERCSARGMQRVLEDEVLGILNRVSCDEQQPAPTNGIETRGERLSRTESL